MEYTFSIIIRSKNEENWIKFCLDAVHRQTLSDYEIIIVDNNSEDASLDICKQKKVNKILTIDKYLPGKALNMGVEASNSKYVVFLSAHCIPSNEIWLESLLNAIEQGEDIMGAYGRQLPFSSSPPDDKRDLMLTFPVEPKIQTKDHMFHNANSIIRSSILEDIPINEEVTNIEDRYWAKEVIAEGYRIAYTPEGCVHHHHGLHQHGTKRSFRSETLAKVLEKIDEIDDFGYPKTINKKEINSPVVVPIKSITKFSKDHLIKLKELCSSTDKDVFVVSDLEELIELSIPNLKIISRNENNLTDSLSLEEVLQKTLFLLEDYYGEILDSLSFVDLDYFYNTFEFVDLAFDRLYEEFVDFVIPAYKDFSSSWIQKPGYIEKINVSLDKKSEKDPLYRASIGLGSCFRASCVRSGNIFNNSGCLLPFLDQKLSLRQKIDD